MFWIVAATVPANPKCCNNRQTRVIIVQNHQQFSQFCGTSVRRTMHNLAKRRQDTSLFTHCLT
jgi:ribosomal protein L7Ae-like RNA K-turn-binding protein